MSLPTLLALLLLLPTGAIETVENYLTCADGALLVGLAGVYVKAGRRGWEALVPVLSEVTLLRVSDRSRWWLVALLFPTLYFAACVVFEASQFWTVCFQGTLLDTTILYVPYQVGVWALLGAALKERFSRGTGFFVGIALLPWIFVPILGVGAARYRPPAPRARFAAPAAG
ncbi:MAG: hypothetical protein JXQ29_02755 [Planctomycetes bacterium]|nr:hypothetical protein [Planctomycetota bacterium]